MTYRLTTAAMGLLALGLFECTTSAQAACKKPVGTFTGSGSGINVVTSLSAGQPVVAYQAAAISLTVNIAKDGTVSAYEEGKISSSGSYYLSWSVKAVDNIFSTATCLGAITDNLGRQYTYTSSGSGTVITFVDTENASGLSIYNILLEKT